MVIIHIVLGKANPNRMNGVNKVVYQLATNQAKAGKEVEVWGISADLTHNYGERNFKTKLFPKVKNPFGLSSELRAAITSENDAIFHLHGGWIGTFWAISKLLKAQQKIAILTPHGAYNSIAMRKSSLRKKLYFHLFEKHLLNNVKRIHCLGKSEKDGLNTIYKNDKQVLLPYGFQFTHKQKQNDNRSKKFIIGFVGRIDIYTKGLDLITSAYNQFAQKNDTELWIIGDSDQLPELKQISSRLENGGGIKFFGSKYGEEKDKLISKMSVFVHASRNEGLPTAVLEAASLGIPSIVSEATNVGQYVVKHKAGFCVPDNDVSKLTEAFENTYEIWKINKMSTLSTGAFKMLTEEFLWSSLIPKYDKLYA